MQSVQNNPDLRSVSSNDRSSVSILIFCQFVSLLEGNVVEMTDVNIYGLFVPCEWFGFRDLHGKLLKLQLNHQTHEIKRLDLDGTAISLKSGLLGE
jgi:hypothetical protein